jgi:thiol-disulfide isomerase/thioredoxin
MRARIWALVTVFVAACVSAVWLLAPLQDGPPIGGAVAKFAADPRPAPQLSFTDADGKPLTLAEFHGRFLLVNLWATWCAPCVKELPALDRLQQALGGDRFRVITISLDRAGAPLVKPFFAERGIANLPTFLDQKGASFAAFTVRGLPTTILLGPDGGEIGRIEGDVDWDAPDARALLAYYLEKPGN